MADDEILLKAEHICRYFGRGRQELKAVDDVSFEIKKGEVFGLVGESGCGKTTTGRTIIKLYDITSGNVYFKGHRICAGTLSYKRKIAQARREYKTANAERRAELKAVMAEQKAQMRAATDDNKNCEKKYMKKLTAEYNAAVRAAGSPQGLSVEERSKFRAVENLPKIPQKILIAVYSALFAVALALLVAAAAMFSQFGSQYGGYKKISAQVAGSDAQSGTTTVTYTVDETLYSKTLDYYNPDLSNAADNIVRLDIWYDSTDPDNVLLNRPSPSAAWALIISSAAVGAAGVAAAIYVNERYNPAKLVTKIQMIFQDPIASLDPRMTVKDIIAEGLIIGGERDKKYIDKKVYEVLDLVGLLPEHAGRYPHEFSGGQRQRIGVARAVVMQPELIIADEPVSALDVSIQAQVVNLLNDLRRELGLTVLFIAHDLSVVKYISDRIGVMYGGKLVEVATAEELFSRPLHPYTKALLSAIPLPDPDAERRRKRVIYDPAADMAYGEQILREVTKGHYVRCGEADFEKYRAEAE